MLPKKIVACLLSLTFLFQLAAHGQSAIDSVSGKLLNFPSRFLGKIQGKTADLDKRLTRQTEKYLDKMARREARLRQQLFKVDSAAAKRLFDNNSQQQYAALAQRMKNDTGSQSLVPGTYLANLDSEKVSLSFLQKNPQLLGATGLASSGKSEQLQAQLKNSIAQIQQLQAKMQDADQAKEFIRQRKEQIKEYLSRYTQLPGGLSKEYQGLNQDLYYYTQQVDQYKQMLNDPGKLEKKAMSLLGQLPAFQQFMKSNSQLAALFGTPANYGTPQSLAGLQTRDQVQQMIQGQLAAGGPDAMAAFQQKLQAAQTQLDQYKDKLSKLGSGGGDVDMPDFRPNNEKTKTFLQRLEYGTNLQTTSTSYSFPVTTDLGLSLGYKLNKSNTVGIGASYKLGWGTGINHIAFTSQGAGLRSFLDIKIKSSFSATGGLEYNYQTPFHSLQQISHLSYWTRSGLIGISKTVSVKSRVFKKTKLQLLWDFLSYQQVPKTQPILFRIGYNF